MKFLQNRAIQVRMIKPDVDTSSPTVSSIDVTAVNDMVLMQVQNAAVCIGGILAGKRILDTLCDISIIAAKSKFK